LEKINALTSFHLDFLGIGAPKAGTTKVADFLAAHPQICLSEPKEVHYFNEFISYIHQQKNPNFEKPLSWYEKHFLHAKKGQKVGEFCTGYLYDQQAIHQIKKLFPTIKLIACIRHPVERAYSQYIMHRYYFKKETRSFEEVIRAEKEYIGKSLFYKQLKPYFDNFEASQLLILQLEDIQQNPKNVTERLYQFLEVDKTFVPSNLKEKSNAAKAVKFSFVSKLMGYFSAAMIALRLSFLLKWLKEKGLRKWVLNWNSTPMDYPPMKPETRAYLNSIFRTDIEQLEDLLNLDLSHWKV